MKVAQESFSTVLKCCVVIYPGTEFLLRQILAEYKTNMAQAINLCPSSFVPITDKPFDS
jgi:hypothetical protein